MTDQNSIQTYHLKLSFSQYEKSYLMEHLNQYQKKIQRHLPKQTIPHDNPFMTSDHRLLQFDSTQTSLIPAYDSFLLDVKFWHIFQPSQLCFTAKLSNSNFSNPYCLLHPSQTDSTPDTLLALDTPTGTHLLPSHLPPHESKPILISQLSLNIHLEQLQYALAPYNSWNQIETEAGHLNFPTNPSVNFSQLPPIQNKQFQPVLPQLPRAVQFNHRRQTQHQSYNLSQNLQDIRNRQSQLFNMVHQQQQPPPQPPVQQQAQQQAGPPNIPQPGPPGPPNVPTLMAELANITQSLHAVEALQAQANPSTQFSPSTTTPRLNSASRATLAGQPPPLPPNFDIHSPSQYPPDPFGLQPHEQSSPRHRLRKPLQSRSEPPSHNVLTGSTPTFNHPSQVKKHWRDNGRGHLLQNQRHLDLSDDDSSQDDLLGNLFNNSHPVTPKDAVQSAAPLVINSSITTTTTTSAPGTNAAATHSVNTSVTTAPTTDSMNTSATAQAATNSVSASVPATAATSSVNASAATASDFHPADNSVPSIPSVDQNSSTLSQPDQQVSNQNDPDTQRNLEIQKKNSDSLNKLADIVQDFPAKNSFRDYAFPDPLNNDFKKYNLPDYLRPYVSELLLRLNTSRSLLPPNLFPYIHFDKKLNRYVTLDSSLDLPSLQKLNHLLNVDKTPNFLTKIKEVVTKRTKSK